MENKVSNYHTRYQERVDFYKSFGYDIEAERKFILESARPLYGDILEVGTGKGYFTVELAKQGYSFTSIDASRQEQDLARRNINHFGLEKLVDFRVENAESLTFKDSSFDAIFMINTVHHLERPYKVIDELIRIISFEGKIILSDFTKDGMEMIAKVHETEGRVHEAGLVSLKRIVEYLEEKKFLVERCGSKFQEVVIGCHSLM